MDKWLQILLIIGGIILLIGIVYAAIAYKNTKAIFKTITAPATAMDDVIAYYYLPAPLIKITATAKVEIVTDTSTNQITKETKLKELNISALSETLPDTSQLLLVKYTRSSFANDDVKIGVNAMGLLENVASVTEDRFTNVITALLEAPSSVLKTTPDAMANLDTAIVVTKEIKEYTKEFILQPDKIIIGGGDCFIWIINVTDEPNNPVQVEASFKVNFSSPFAANSSNQSTASTIVAGDGIYVRPSIALQISFLPYNNNPLQTISANAATITVPDVTKAILLSVTRTMMVKKTQTLKLQNGMLLENAIIKPSESEAFISIPVNILKAIFSIPAQLLTFRIHHIQQQKTLKTEDAAFAKAKLDSEKARLGTNAELSKAKLEAQKTLASYEQDILKAKLDTQKAVVDAEKAKITSETDLAKAKLDNEKTKQGADTELAKAKLEREKALQEAQKNVFTEQTNVLKAWQGLLEEMKKKLPG